MGLQPLEFSDCLTDSPYFRDNLHSHEKELERTSKSIKNLVQECKEVLTATRNLQKTQRSFAQHLMDFKFECIGMQQTDDEIVIAQSLQEFGKLIASIEDERDKMLTAAYDQFIKPLEDFRKDQIGGAKEGKKKFDKQTRAFCQSLEKFLNLKTKATDNVLQEADAALQMERKHFQQASMEYVLMLQEVQERKKFEFIEILLGFMYAWLTFYHQGHEVAQEFKPYMTELQVKLQKTRDNYETTRTEAETLMNKMLEVRGTKPNIEPTTNKNYTRQGYLFLMEKKALGTTSWTKYYCMYQKNNKILTMIPFNPVQNAKLPSSTETMVLTSCVRRATDSIDKRFCFDITAQDRQGTYTLQALSEEDRSLWLDAMDGREPIYLMPKQKVEESSLDDTGFLFIQRCIDAIEARGLEDQGLYRVVGVNSKVTKLAQMGLDRRKLDKLNLDDEEIKTITSALKNYFRSLPEPIMTFKQHTQLLAAAKLEQKKDRVREIHKLVHQLPEANFKFLRVLIKHLRMVSQKHAVNLMTVSNVGVCFGPTLMRPEEETVAAIMDIKFCNIVVEILIENYDLIFGGSPDQAENGPASQVPESPRRSLPVPEHVQSPTSLAPGGPTSPGRNYANLDNNVNNNSSGYKGLDAGQTYAQYRSRLRPVAIYNPGTPAARWKSPGSTDVYSSTSSSSESLSSKSSSNNQSSPSINALSQSSPQLDVSRRPHTQPPMYANTAALADQGGLLSPKDIMRLDQPPQLRREDGYHNNSYHNNEARPKSATFDLFLSHTTLLC
ncbi:rho GTPase-activating protein 26 isoform X2 [Lingula anatina]|uniref:Rho GTPase-activating protein 26 isoform X2 n=1 Tax=Lingula anatina TaxID=7574 RepID=A0A1S3JSA8_LINAN|nr:rho GTPase-activating protein 26 isoform X2 [Lingula anatina]|eukprot:XP_013413273.1 rho GTPase-activating protein 26 isoform X2 [Lingula anatina]